MKVEFKDFSKQTIKAININLEKALAESALAMEGYAKINCPAKTGRLRASISSKSSILTGGAKEEADVGTNVEYAPHVEYGTKYQKPKPYLRTGAQDSLNDIKRIFKKRLGSIEIKNDNI